MVVPSPLQGLAPVLDHRTRLLVLGSFPSVTSLAQGRYYAHPRNHFWPILGALWKLPLIDMTYPERTQALLDHQLGVWDVYASCQRAGSLDAAIQDPVPNDLAALKTRCPGLVAVAHNGGESWRHARVTRELGWQVYRLPSSSPAHASWSLARKVDAWRDVMAAHGLAPKGD